MNFVFFLSFTEGEQWICRTFSGIGKRQFNVEFLSHSPFRKINSERMFFLPWFVTWGYITPPYDFGKIRFPLLARLSSLTYPSPNPTLTLTCNLSWFSPTWLLSWRRLLSAMLVPKQIVTNALVVRCEWESRNCSLCSFGLWKQKWSGQRDWILSNTISY